MNGRFEIKKNEESDGGKSAVGSDGIGNEKGMEGR